MQIQPLHMQVTTLVRELGQFHGYRTVWIDLHGRLCHSEPDEELEGEGFLYVTTVMRPSEDVLAEAVSLLASLHPERASFRTWARRGRAASLLPVGA
jgi:hypothetical protein